MRLTDERRHHLFEHGVLRLPGIVPDALVENGRRAINASLGERGMDPQQLTTYRARTYCPELIAQPVIADLYNASPVREIAEAAIGTDRIRPVESGQIALRFPALGTAKEPSPHIDGMYAPNNGVKKGTIANFTALVGVFLSDIPHVNMGNFSVWPGSHRTLEDYFASHGPQSLLSGFPAVDIGSPQQVTARAGDAVLCHYQLAHGIASNTSSHIRYGIFFRLTHVDHDTVHWECMTDIWREWDGMQAYRVTTPQR